MAAIQLRSDGIDPFPTYSAHSHNLTDEQVLEATGEAQEKLHVTKNKGGIVVKGIHDVAVRFSKCCSPIPGDEIVGFVTRGRGITIHRTAVNASHINLSLCKDFGKIHQKTSTSKQEKATISISFEIGSKEELSSLVAKIRQVESVIDVERTTG